MILQIGAIRMLSIVGSLLSVVLGAPAIVLVVGSLVRPDVPITGIYDAYNLTNKAMLGFGILFVSLLLVLKMFSDNSTEIRRASARAFRSRMVPFRVVVVVLALFAGATYLFPGFNAVIRSGSQWMITSRAFHPREVSESVALTHLWRAIRFNSLAILCLSFILAYVCTSVLQGTHSSTLRDEPTPKGV
jgi:hypothetical protein